MRRTARLLFAGGSALLLLTFLAPSPAKAFPAFARKYGLRCTACHEAWPALNDFGRAFRDNGYQLGLGQDNPTQTPLSYIPIAIRLTPHYEYNTASHQTTDQGTQTLKSGSVADIGLDLLTGGTLFDNVSFLVVPTGFTADDGVTLESAWVRLDNLGGSSWANFKLGKHEVDLPRSAHRPWNLSSTGYLIYGYHSPGSASIFDMGENQRGIEWVGHDRGSFTRFAVSVFDVEESPGSRNILDTPGVYGHFTREWLFDGYGLSAFRIGVFGSYTTWPTSGFTADGEPIPGQGTDLKGSSKVGFDASFWLGPNVTPVHVLLVYAHGQDDKALIPDATRNGSFNGGFLEVGYTPKLKTTVFFRYDMVRNSTQGVPDTPKSFLDEDAETFGIRHTFNFTNRAEYALHAEFSSMRTKLVADDGGDVRSNTLFLGIDFAY
jgi:hypothetical protein